MDPDRACVRGCRSKKTVYSLIVWVEKIAMRPGMEAAEMERVSTTVSTDMKKGLGFCFFWWVLAIPKHVISESLIPEQMTTQQAEIGANQTFLQPCTATDWCKKNRIHQPEETPNRNPTGQLQQSSSCCKKQLLLAYFLPFFFGLLFGFVNERFTCRNIIRGMNIYGIVK